MVECWVGDVLVFCVCDIGIGMIWVICECVFGCFV